LHAGVFRGGPRQPGVGFGLLGEKAGVLVMPALHGALGARELALRRGERREKAREIRFTRLSFL